ncbi:MAG: RHS repeat-associated core domain-containing protein, partial [Faecousia sp.]
SGSTVASYTYDPYGKVLTATGTMAETNPLRYRGYYYDTETALYYLQSRYYDPTICRFINADAYTSTGQGILGHNMFAYCRNNPVCMKDETGTLGIYVVVEEETRKVEENEEGTVYSYTITYAYFNIPFYFLSYMKTSTVEYTVTKDGIIIFDNSQKGAYALLDEKFLESLSKNMMKKTKKLVPDSLQGRTTQGISFELLVHYLASTAGIKPENTDVTHIGSSVPGSVGYDYNADWFERPLANIDEIIAALR